MPPLAILAAAAIAAGATVYATERARAAANKKKDANGMPTLGNTGVDGLGTAATDRQNLGNQGQNRDYVHLDNSLGDESRRSQMDALGMMRQAALGEVPSVAQLQMQQGLDQAVRNQAAMASSARGMSALALAQQNAAVNTAMLNQRTASDQSILRAQEMDAARGAYGGMATGIRGLDEGRAATQAGLEAQQRGLNDQYQLGMYGQAGGLLQSQVQARNEANQQQIQIWLAKAGMNKEAQERAAQQNQQTINNGLGAAQGAIQTGMALNSSGQQQQQQGQNGQPAPSTGGTGMMAGDWDHDPT